MMIEPFGSEAVLVHLPPEKIISVHHSLTEGTPNQPSPDQPRIHWLVESIPAEDTLLIRLDQPCTPDVLRELSEFIAEATAHPSASVGDNLGTVDIAVHYQGEDIKEVAAACGMSIEHLIELHAQAEYRVAFCGFSPGFAYLKGLPGQLHLPRRATPRTAVPAGSVAIAEHYSAIYPRSSPGGWHLLGYTDEVLFDPTRDSPARLNAGMQVRFVPSRAPMITLSDRAALPSHPHTPAVEIISPGVSSLVQDLGRIGWGAAAVSPSGAWDRQSHRLAQRLVGNPEQAAGLECVGGGLHLRALRAITIAVTGAPGPVYRRQQGVRTAVDAFTGLTLAAGDEVIIGAATTGLRRYVALRGGIDTPEILGSRSFDTLSQLGPRPLASLDLIGVQTTSLPIPGIDGVVIEPSAPALETYFWPTPIWAALHSDTDIALADGAFTVSPNSDRIGVRLNGPALTWDVPPPPTAASRPMVRGAIQLPPDGRPLILGPDHPTTGGYPVIGVLTDPDAPAQWPPGATVRLRPRQ